jgi:Holliday junction resolvase RusA-like endonuclease
MTPPAITIVVRGTPAPQGSKRHVGGGRMVEMSKRVKPWREAVRSNAEDAIQAQGDYWPGPLAGALAVEMVFTATRPKSHYRTGRNAALLRDGVPPQPTGAPDLDKLARSTCDALTDSGAIEDDARIVEYRRLAKVYAAEDPDALSTPGAVIRIYCLEDA